MKLAKFAIIAFLITSCASSGTKAIKKDIDDGDVSLGAVLDLARSSYLKGCVDGMKHITKKKTYGVIFEYCKVQSIQHEKDIKLIFEQ